MATSATEEDGALLAHRLRNLPADHGPVSIARSGADWQANCKIDGGFRVDVRADPVLALLVATGAVHVTTMNRRDTERRVADLNALAQNIASKLTAEDMDLLG